MFQEQLLTNDVVKYGVRLESTFGGQQLMHGNGLAQWRPDARTPGDNLLTKIQMNERIWHASAPWTRSTGRQIQSLRAFRQASSSSTFDGLNGLDLCFISPYNFPDNQLNSNHHQHLCSWVNYWNHFNCELDLEVVCAIPNLYGMFVRNH